MKAIRKGKKPEQLQSKPRGKSADALCREAEQMLLDPQGRTPAWFNDFFHPDVRDLIQKVEDGNPKAERQLKQVILKSYKLLKAASDKGSGRAAYLIWGISLSNIAMQMLHGLHDDIEANEALILASRRQYPDAMFYLGRYLYETSEKPDQRLEGLRLWKQAVENGSLKAVFSAWVFCDPDLGNGIKGDLDVKTIPIVLKKTFTTAHAPAVLNYMLHYYSEYSDNISREFVDIFGKEICTSSYWLNKLLEKEHTRAYDILIERIRKWMYFSTHRLIDVIDYDESTVELYLILNERSGKSVVFDSLDYPHRRFITKHMLSNSDLFDSFANDFGYGESTKHSIFFRYAAYHFNKVSPEISKKIDKLARSGIFEGSALWLGATQRFHEAFTSYTRLLGASSTYYFDRDLMPLPENPEGYTEKTWLISRAVANGALDIVYRFASKIAHKEPEWARILAFNLLKDSSQLGIKNRANAYKLITLANLAGDDGSQLFTLEQYAFEDNPNIDESTVIQCLRAYKPTYWIDAVYKCWLWYCIIDRFRKYKASDFLKEVVRYDFAQAISLILLDEWQGKLLSSHTHSPSRIPLERIKLSEKSEIAAKAAYNLFISKKALFEIDSYQHFNQSFIFQEFWTLCSCKFGVPDWSEWNATALSYVRKDELIAYIISILSDNPVFFRFNTKFAHDILPANLSDNQGRASSLGKMLNTRLFGYIPDPSPKIIEACKLLPEKILQRKNALRAQLEAERSRQEVLSYLTHTLNNAFATGPETLREILRALQEGGSNDIRHRKVVNQAAALFWTFSFAENLLKTFRLYLADTEFVRSSWRADSGGEADIPIIIYFSLRLALARVLFSDNRFTGFRHLLAVNDPKAAKAAFLADLMSLEPVPDAVEPIRIWLEKYIPGIKVNIDPDPMRFHPNKIRFMFLFSCLSEFFFNALKYNHGPGTLDISWNIKDQSRTLTVQNPCPPDLQGGYGTGKGLAFIHRIVGLLHDSSLVARPDGEIFKVVFTLGARNFEGEPS